MSLVITRRWGECIHIYCGDETIVVRVIDTNANRAKIEVVASKKVLIHRDNIVNHSSKHLDVKEKSSES